MSFRAARSTPISTPTSPKTLVGDPGPFGGAVRLAARVFSCRLKSAPSAAATSLLTSSLHKKKPRFQKKRGCGGP